MNKKQVIKGLSDLVVNLRLLNPQTGAEVVARNTKVNHLTNAIRSLELGLGENDIIEFEAPKEEKHGNGPKANKRRTSEGEGDTDRDNSD